MEKLAQLAQIASNITAIAALAVLFIRPLRERVMGMHHIRDGMRCLLRSDMLRTYYRHRNECEIRQYEYENFLFAYQAYKALKGNSFIDKIYKEVTEWEVLS